MYHPTIENLQCSFLRQKKTTQDFKASSYTKKPPLDSCFLKKCNFGGTGEKDDVLCIVVCFLILDF